MNCFTGLKISLKNGVQTVVVMKPNDQGIEKVIYYHQGFEISTVGNRYESPDVLAIGVVGELWSDSVICGPFKEDVGFYEKLVSEFPGSGMQVWVNSRDTPKGQISTGLANVQNIFSFPNEMSDQALELTYKHFLQVTGHYHDFVHSNLRLKS